MAWDCPKKNTSARALGSGQRPIALARMFALMPGDAKASNDVVTCTLLLFSHYITVLFDLGTTLFYVKLLSTLGYENTRKS